MKKLLLTLTLVAASAVTMFGQGRVGFNNQSTFLTTDAITVSTANQGAIGGNAGWGIGGDKYAVQLLWVQGVAANQAAFDAATPVASAVFSGSVFLANTSDLANFSGFFDAGVVNQGTPAGPYTMQVRAWYNVGAPNATYAQALANSVNTGRSALFSVAVTASPTPVNSTVFPGFQVGLVPEPSTLALAGLGAAAMLIFRRKK